MRERQTFLLPLTIVALCFNTATVAEDGVTADRFLAALAGNCGNAYRGEIIANEPPMADDPFVGKTLTMHIRECGAGAVRVPFHVGEDRSRTWVFTRSGDGLHLAHDHRHEDGSPDTLTMYGGRTTEVGSDTVQRFPADAYTVGLFEREGRLVSIPNVWTVEFHPGSHAIYELARPGRLFRVRFDLTAPIEPPPAPWGAAE